MAEDDEVRREEGEQDGHPLSAVGSNSNSTQKKEVKVGASNFSKSQFDEFAILRKSLEQGPKEVVGLGFGGLLDHELGSKFSTSAVFSAHGGLVVQRRHLISVQDGKDRKSGEAQPVLTDQAPEQACDDSHPTEEATESVDASIPGEGEPGVLQNTIRGWIGNTAPLARDITLAATAKAGINLPVSVMSWWGGSPTKRQGPAESFEHPSGGVDPQPTVNNNKTSSEKAFRGLIDMGVNLVMGPGIVVPASSASGEGADQLQVVVAAAEEKTQQADCIIRELKQSLKDVIGESVKCKGEPMGDGVYVVTVFCALVEQVLGYGLKEGSGGGRWPFWGTGRLQPSFFSVLESLEQSVPENQSFRASLGLDAVRELNWVRSSVGQLRAWLRLSLNAGLLGMRLSILVEDPDLLEQWYESWAVLRKEDASAEFVSIVMALSSVRICLSVSEGLALDHQRFITSKPSTGHLTVVEPPGQGTCDDMVSCTDVKQGNKQHYDATVPGQRVRAGRRTGSRKRVISVLHADIDAQEMDRRLEFGGYTLHAGPTDETSEDIAKVAMFEVPAEPCLTDDSLPASTRTKHPSPGREWGEMVEQKSELFLEVTNGHGQVSFTSDLVPSPPDSARKLPVEMRNAMEQEQETDPLDLTAQADVYSQDGQGDDQLGVTSGDEHIPPLPHEDVLASSASFQLPVEGKLENEGPLSHDSEEGVNKSGGVCYVGNGVDNPEPDVSRETSLLEEHPLREEFLGSGDDEASGSLSDMSMFQEETQVDEASSRPREPFNKDSGRPRRKVGDELAFGGYDWDEYFEQTDVEPGLFLEASQEESQVAGKNLPCSTELQKIAVTSSDILSGMKSSQIKLQATEGILQETQIPLIDPGSLSQGRNRQTQIESSNKTDHRLPFVGEVRLEEKLLVAFKDFHANSTEESQESSVAGDFKSGLDNVGERVNVFFTGTKSLDSFTEEEKPGENARKGCVMRLGSKEAEELLQLDVAKLGRASSQSVKGVARAQTMRSTMSPGIDWGAEDLGPDELSRYVEKLEVRESYIDTVLDMESVLLEAEDSNGSRMFQDTKSTSAGSSYPTEEGSLDAVTSQQLSGRVKEVYWVEVVGARQRKGGASFGERVVGVQEHTVYRILVKGDGNDEWEIERRYRDFVSLYGQLCKLFSAQSGFVLPSPWDKVKAESRKFFGNTSPNAVEVRSALIQVCLQSLIQAGAPFKTCGPLMRFLLPGDTQRWSSPRPTSRPLANSQLLKDNSAPQLPLEDFITTQSDSPRSDTVSSVADQDQDGKTRNVFGKTIRLIVQVHARRPLKQQLHAQHDSCAGCYQHLVSATGLVPGLVQSLGLTGPRLCEYSGQLFCSACHSNDTAVIPAQVLQKWDFSPRKVSQLAKAYLDSIYEQPMLCVSAVNPYLYGKVPILANVREMRRKLSRIIACVHCPARSRILGMVGSRRYLFENNDFFALRDLADLSKGAFAVLPGFMRSMSEKLFVHVTRQCSVCYESGEPCGAGEWCDDPFDTIFPFQDDNIKRCPSCQVPFHKMCFANCSDCPSCHGRSPAPVAKEMHSTIEPSTAESIKELRNLNSSRKSSRRLDTTLESGESSSSANSDKRRSKRNNVGGFLSSNEGPPSSKGNRGTPLVLNMSALLGPLEL